jgi:hypothetical protein
LSCLVLCLPHLHHQLYSSVNWGECASKWDFIFFKMVFY